MATTLDFVLGTDRFLNERSSYRLGEVLATQICAQRHGLPVNSYSLPPEPEFYIPRLQDRMENGWHLSDPAVRPAVEVPPGRELVANEILFGSGEEIVEVDQGSYKGTNLVGGCRGEALRAVYGSVDSWNKLINGQPRAYNAAVARIDPAALASAAEKWVACMRDLGLDFAEPQAARHSFAVRFAAEDSAPSESLLSEERDVALADGQCTIKAGYPDLKRGAAMAYIDSLDAGSTAELTALVNLHRRVSGEARQYVKRAKLKLGGLPKK